MTPNKPDPTNGEEKMREELQKLKCVNGAMYFGSVENDECDCKTRCQNEQTFEHALDELTAFVLAFHLALLEQMKAETASKNEAYRERNILVATLSKLFPAYLARHDESDKEWEDDWRWIVYIMIPVKEKVVSGDQHNHTPEKYWFKTTQQQISWHIHDSERHLFDHLEVKENNWDGHNTQRKYERLTAINLINTDLRAKIEELKKTA